MEEEGEGEGGEEGEASEEGEGGKVREEHSSALLRCRPLLAMQL